MNYPGRLCRVQQWLDDNRCDALIVEKPIDILYLTGIDLSLGKLLIGRYDQPTLFVDGRYIERCRRVPFLNTILLDGTALETWLASGPHSSWQSIAFDSEATSYKAFVDWQAKLSAAAGQASLKAVEAPIKRLRAIKDPEEIVKLREAASLGSRGYDFAVSLLKEGISEIEVATALELFWKQQGAKGLAFEPIIAFGANSAMPHYHPGDTVLHRGDIVLIDIGVNLDGYHSDMTRTLFFGFPDPQLLKLHEDVQRAQAAALAICRSGVPIAAVDAAARNLLPLELFVHGLGHGVGLEIHESPVISHKHPDRETPLEVGMVVTIEPGGYIPGRGGVRIEDTIVITSNGYEDLTLRPKGAVILAN
jgi:Xaa-Pro aminopeptidase